MNPKIALEQLIAGNQRYMQEKLEHPNRSKEARLCAASGQNPFAIIMGCADSRVSPEIIFDQGIGDLFVVRVAGNVVGSIELDSIEFSAQYLKSSIIMVLGHESCGAIQAVINGQTQDIETIASLIAPSLEHSRTLKGSLVENTVKHNVLSVVNQLKNCPTLAKLIAAGQIDVVGGYYNFQTGGVDLLC